MELEGGDEASVRVASGSIGSQGKRWLHSQEVGQRVKLVNEGR